MNPIARLFGITPREAASPWADRSALEQVTWAHLLGVDADGLPPTRSQAMSVDALAKGRTMICSSIARLPLIPMKDADPATEVPQIIEQPEEGRSRFHTLLWTIDALIWYGVAWWVVTDRAAPSDGGRPRRVMWVPQWRADVDEDGALVRAFDQPVSPADVIRFDGIHEGVLRFGAERIQSALRLDRSALRASDNPVPDVELHQTSGTPLTPDEARALVRAYAEQRRRVGVSYTNQSVETRVHGAQVENLLIDGRRAAALTAARLLCLPAWAVDATVEGQSMTYTNVPSRARELIDYTLAPLMECVTSRLSMDDIMPRGAWCRFDTDPLLHADFGDRMASYKTALEAGVYTIDELRKRENGTPLEGPHV